MEATIQLPTNFAPEGQRFHQPPMVTLWSGMGLLAAKLATGHGDPMISALVARIGGTSVLFALFGLPFTLSTAQRAAVKR
jgi:hypothetical protein